MQKEKHLRAFENLVSMLDELRESTGEGVLSDLGLSVAMKQLKIICSSRDGVSLKVLKCRLQKIYDGLDVQKTIISMMLSISQQLEGE